MLTAVSATFYCLTFLSCHAPLQFLLLGVPIFNVLIYFLIYFLICSVKAALITFALMLSWVSPKDTFTILMR